jgi:hypothetical protein
VTAWFSPYTPVETRDDLPLFCPACGYPMKVEWRVMKYDPMTGVPLGRSEARCTKPWWSHWATDHQIYVVSPRPRHK